MVKKEAVKDIKKTNKFNLYIRIALFVIILAIVGIVVTFIIHSENKEEQSDEVLNLGNKYIDGLEYDQAIAEFEYIITIDPLKLNIEREIELIDSDDAENTNGQTGTVNVVNVGGHITQEEQKPSVVQDETVLEIQSESVQTENTNTNNSNNGIIVPSEVTTFESAETLEEDGNYIVPVEIEDDELQTEGSEDEMETGQQEIENNEEGMEIGQQEIENNEEGMEIGQQEIENNEEGMEIGQQEIENNEEGMEVGQQEIENSEEGVGSEQEISTETAPPEFEENTNNNTIESNSGAIIEPTEQETQEATPEGGESQESSSTGEVTQETTTIIETSEETTSTVVEPTVVEPQEAITNDDTTQTIISNEEVMME